MDGWMDWRSKKEEKEKKNPTILFSHYFVIRSIVCLLNFLQIELDHSNSSILYGHRIIIYWLTKSESNLGNIELLSWGNQISGSSREPNAREYMRTQTDTYSENGSLFVNPHLNQKNERVQRLREEWKKVGTGSKLAMNHNTQSTHNNPEQSWTYIEQEEDRYTSMENKLWPPWNQGRRRWEGQS